MIKIIEHRMHSRDIVGEAEKNWYQRSASAGTSTWASKTYTVDR